jgi:mycothiol synthase
MKPSAPGSRVSVTVHDRLSDVDVDDLLRLVEHATAADCAAPLGEHSLMHVRKGAAPHAEHLVARATGVMVGYGLLDRTDRSSGWTAELVVDPGHRRHGVGAALVRAMLARTAPDPLRLWAHGNHAGAGRLAEALGFGRVRDLWLMRLSLPADALQAEPTLPAGVSVRTFVAGADDEAWVELNERAFAQHPEQGRLTVADLQARMAQPWFDPAGFFLAERGGRLVGFHWTKVHGGSGHHGHDPIGEVYVLGVDPAAQGGGLGRALTVIGLRHLCERGLDEVMLYVDADNTPAIATYQRLGFVHESTDVMYARG